MLSTFHLKINYDKIKILSIFSYGADLDTTNITFEIQAYLVQKNLVFVRDLDSQSYNKIRRNKI